MSYPADKYQGITHGVPNRLLESEDFIQRWKKNRCSKGIHLFDEVWSCTDHYLSCDACDLIVNIDNIDKSYVRGVKRERRKAGRSKQKGKKDIL
jgi:hypothetical protein